VSVVTNVVVLAGPCVLIEDDDTFTAAFAFVQETLARDHNGQRFVVPSVVGGSKQLEGEAAIAAFNHVPPHVVLGILRSAPWLPADVVQVAIMGQEDDAWTLHRVFGSLQIMSIDAACGPSEEMTDLEVLHALLYCVECWAPDVRLHANLRAGDIARALRLVVTRTVPAPIAATDPAGGPNPLKALSSTAEIFQGWGPVENR
jgi:hypothetical protein